MEKIYKGVYATTTGELMFSRLRHLLYKNKGNKLIIRNDKLILTLNGEDVELPKEQIKSITGYFRWGAVRINHSNPTLPKMLAFTHVWPLSLLKVFRENGYTEDAFGPWKS